MPSVSRASRADRDYVPHRLFWSAAASAAAAAAAAGAGGLKALTAAVVGVQDCMELRVDSITDTVGYIERMPLPPGLDGYHTDHTDGHHADVVRQPRQPSASLPRQQ